MMNVGETIKRSKKSIRRAAYLQHVDETERTICGRPYSVQQTIDAQTKRKGFRILIEGVMHPAGKLPIRFKSIDRGVAHCLTMGLSK